MVSLPKISKFFKTIEIYRYSITVGLFLLYITPYFFPVGWETVGATWEFVAGIMFFISVGMILVNDFWPWFEETIGCGVRGEDKKKIATKMIEMCKESDSDAPFRLYISDIGEDIDNGLIRKFVKGNMYDSECRIDDDSIIVTEKGVKALGDYI